MIKPNAVDQWIWRLNGILILAGILILVIALCYQLLKSVLRDNHRAPENIVENIAEDPKNQEKWVLGRPINIDGANMIMLPLVSENKQVDISEVRNFAGSSYNKSYGKPSKNILFINTDDNQSTWLFNDTQRLILNTQLFPNDYESDKATQAIFYHVVSHDSNKDKKLNDQDDTSLFISNPRGENYQLLLKAYDKIISKTMAGKNSALLVYQFQGSAHSMLIQLSPFKIISDNPLPRVNH